MKDQEQTQQNGPGLLAQATLLGKLGDAIRKTLPAIGVNAEVTVEVSDGVIIIDSDKAYVRITLSGMFDDPKFGIVACKCWRRQQLVQSPPIRMITTDHGTVRQPLGCTPKEMRMRLQYARHRWLVWFSGFRNQLMNFPVSIIRVVLPFNYPVDVHNLPNDGDEPPNRGSQQQERI